MKTSTDQGTMRKFSGDWGAAMGFLIYLCLMSGVLQAQEAPPSQEFLTVLSQGASMTPLARGLRIAVDQNGNTYVTSRKGRSPFSIQTSKLSPAGAVLWSQNFAATPGGSPLPGGVAVDGQGNVYVVGTDLFSATGILLKYDPEGVLISTQSAPFAFFPLLIGIAFDSFTGHLYVVWDIANPVHRRTNILIAEFDTDLRIMGSPLVVDDGSNFSNDARGIATDGQGNVYVGGLQLRFSPQAENALMMKFGPHLTPQAYKKVLVAAPAFRNIAVNGIAADPSGQAYGAGHAIMQLGSVEGILVKLDAGGALQFLREFRTSNTSADIFTGVAADAQGNAYIAGSFFFGFLQQSFPRAVKYDSAGAILWNIAPFGQEGNMAQAVALDPQRNVYLGGWVGPAFSRRSAFAAKFKQALPALSLAALSPLSQDGTVTKVLPQPLRVRVLEGQTPKAGVAVRWSIVAFPQGAAGQDLLAAPGFPGMVVASRDVPTNNQGESAVNLKLGDRTGTYLIAANVPDTTPSQIQFAAQGKLFLQISLSTSSIKPVPFSRVVTAENQAALTVRAFGVQGATDTVADYPVVFISSTVPNSGGHDHDGARPFGGVFSGAGLAVANNTASGRTNAQGEFFAVFTSTFFGGIEVFATSSTIDVGVAPATATLTIKAGDFHLLPNTTFYIKDGGTCLHHGPAGPVDCVTPDRNHYATSATTSAIAAIAAEWLNIAPTRMLEINDMSLELGGGFDVGGNWTADIIDQFPADTRKCNSTGHCEHRDGRSIDIQVFSGTSPKRLSQRLQDRLTRVILKYGGRKHPEGSHWHIKFAR